MKYFYQEIYIMIYVKYMIIILEKGSKTLLWNRLGQPSVRSNGHPEGLEMKGLSSIDTDIAPLFQQAFSASSIWFCAQGAEFSGIHWCFSSRAAKAS
jgi:hypothetical protein